MHELTILSSQKAAQKSYHIGEMILEQQNHSLPADCHKSCAKKGQHEEDTQAVKIFSFYFIYLGVEKKGTAFQKVTSLQWVLKVYQNVDFVLHKGEN